MMNPTQRFYNVKDESVVGGPVSRPKNYGANSVPPLGPEPDGSYYWQLWRDEPARPGQYYDPQTSDPVVNVADSRVEETVTWVEWSADRRRAALGEAIEQQVSDSTVKGTVRDPLVETDIARESAAATDKLTELQETDDGDLDAFDPTIDVAPPQNGKGYAQLAIDIRELTPWAGAPDDYLGFEAVLNIQTEYDDQGSEARLYVVAAPSDVGAVLPFAQDVDDPKKWSVTAREGHMWADPETPCSVQLLWGAGSLPISPVVTCQRQNDRRAAVVRYAEPAGSTRRK